MAIGEGELEFLAAKVAALEVLVRALLAAHFKASANPQQEARAFAERLTAKLEEKMSGGPHDRSTMLVVGQIQSLFDAMKLGE